MSLQSLQTAMSAYIQNDQFISDPSLLPTARSYLKIHQRHYWYSYQKALAVNFPLTRKWIGDDWPILVRAFLDRHPWEENSLIGLGCDLPVFLSSSALMQRFPFIADVAEFEQMRQTSAHNLGVVIDALKIPAGVSPADMKVLTQPLCIQQILSHSIMPVWKKFHDEGVLEKPASRSVAVFCHRDRTGVVQYETNPALFYFHKSLRELNLLEAVEQQLEKNSDFNVDTALSQLNILGAIDTIVDRTNATTLGD